MPVPRYVVGDYGRLCALAPAKGRGGGRAGGGGAARPSGGGGAGQARRPARRATWAYWRHLELRFEDGEELITWGMVHYGGALYVCASQAYNVGPGRGSGTPLMDLGPLPPY